MEWSLASPEINAIESRGPSLKEIYMGIETIFKLEKYKDIIKSKVKSEFRMVIF